MNLEDKMIINQFGAVPPSLLPEILEGLKKDMKAALEEWDEVKAAEIRHTAELLEKHLDPLHRTTAEEIGRKEKKDDKR